jgi:hypothetical protein
MHRLVPQRACAHATHHARTHSLSAVMTGADTTHAMQQGTFRASGCTGIGCLRARHCATCTHRGSEHTIAVPSFTGAASAPHASPHKLTKPRTRAHCHKRAPQCNHVQQQGSHAWQLRSGAETAGQAHTHTHKMVLGLLADSAAKTHSQSCRQVRPRRELTIECASLAVPCKRHTTRHSEVAFGAGRQRLHTCCREWTP